MHMGDLRLNIVSIISAHGRLVPVAAGPRLALKYKGTRNVALCYFGDGATSRGDWHEGLNLAAVQKLPVVYICNNNQYAYSTPLEQQMACANVADRGPAYGHSGGNCGWQRRACRASTPRSRAVEHARAGLGPYLIECKTFRMTGHSAHDGAALCSQASLGGMGQADPIARLEQAHAGAGLGRAAPNWTTARVACEGKWMRPSRGPRTARIPTPPSSWMTSTKSARRWQPPTWKQSAKGSGKRWSATRTCSSLGRTSASMAALSR